MSERDYRESHLSKGEHYDAAIQSDPFDAFMSVQEAKCVSRWVHDRFPLRPARYLDFACGTGRMTAVVGPMARAVIGLDISPSMLAQAKKKLPEYKFVVGDLTSDPLQLGQFDLVTAFRFFGNAQDDLRNAALDAIRDHMQPGAYLIIDNHRNPLTLNRMAKAVLKKRRLIETKEWSRMDLHYWKMRSLLRSHGFQIVDVHGIGWWIVLARMANSGRLQSAARWLEFGGRIGALAAVSPCMLVLARRT